MTAWKECTFECHNADEEALKLINIGAGGVEILSPTSLRCFIPCDSGEAESFASKAVNQGFTLVKENYVDSAQWHAKCSELWQPVVLGKFRVIPIPTSESACHNKIAQDEILLIPGMGFGTGHHIATKFCAEMLQRAPQSKRVLDVGTGSGLLALIAAMHHGAKVDAIDIDPLALDNAKENVEINKLSGSIKLHLGSIDKARGPYDLIVANLYAELLCEFECEMFNLLAPRGMLVVSGIASGLRENIIQTYSPARWKIIDSNCAQDWCGIAFTKA